ncbi:hypothetical protein AJ79_07047 [Helicocarpus griseus UAMH5409]|uniref:Phosphatidic acid phosphatase type 2/haloperoxidase domain-containing protein n=1 Tax=Helicocarpus griseus UAMH5409 TaxID=1447875 RepID=A0A2B7X6X9_9EURO|nr:hypothetical protein AJ79_07047 [Helicocarpus griseus UAMH5409]
MDSALPNTLPFSKKPLKARIIISYISDYVILIALIVGFFILDKIEPFHQPFSPNNHSLHYPYADPERISIPVALALSGGIPLVTILLYTIVIDGLFSHNKPVSSSGRRKLMGPYRLKDRLWEFNCGFLGLILAQGSAFVITQALKVAVGKPRPDVIDRCKPQGLENLGPYQMATYSMCDMSIDHHVLQDGFKSFPSASFAGLFYLSLYLGGKLHVMDSRGEAWKTIIVLVPTLGAALIAATRIMDARHHPFDVLFGSLLGIICAYIAYRQYFPPLSESWRKGRAYPIRTWGTDPSGPPHAARRRFDLGESNDTMAPLRPATDPEDQATSNSQNDVFTRKPPTVRRTSSDQVSTSDPYMRRRSDMDRNYSSSSSDSVGVAYEMQPAYGNSRIQGSESTTQLNPVYQPPQSSYQPYRVTQSPVPPRSPPLGARPVSPVEPLKSS